MRNRLIQGLLLLVISKAAFAGMMVESSRVVYSAGERERSLMLANTNDYPVIVQTWIDHGDPNGTPENASNIPAIPLPGIFRLEPGEKKMLRLLSTQIAQPKDRESLYWLNIYEIPPTDAHLPPGTSAVKVAVRLQLKMFWRPQALKMDREDVLKALRFTLVRKPGSLALKIVNPTPYYATFKTGILSDGAVNHPINIPMVAPLSEEIIPVDVPGNWQPKRLNYILINDDGDDEKTTIDF